MGKSARTRILLTGCNSGIGRATAERLAGRDVDLILHARTDEKARRTRNELAAAEGAARLETVAADLASRDAIRALAQVLADRNDHLSVLINNAGLAGDQPHTWTVNVLAPFRLAYALRPLLAAAPGSARIVNVASVAQSAIDLDALPAAEDAEGPGSYGRSKLAVVMLTFEMARRWRDDAIQANALHPGTLLDTKMVRESFGRPRGPAEEGAEVLEYHALSGDLDGVSGEYFDQKRRARAHEQAYDEAACARLWEITARMAGIA
jgi:NAD(P)-dependent dehydrogenase (short-subunit alcohol dehydrogenase family)